MQDLIEHAKKVSRDSVEALTEPLGDIAPVMVCTGPYGITIMAIEEMGDGEQKDKLALWMTATLVVSRAEAAVTVTTAWMVSVNPDDPNVDLMSGTMKGPVAEHPNRIEVVTLMCASRDKELLITAPLTRYPDRPPTLGDWDSKGEDATAMAGGRFGKAMYLGLKMADKMPQEMVDLLDDGWADDTQHDLIRRFVNVAKEFG